MGDPLLWMMGIHQAQEELFSHRFNLERCVQIQLISTATEHGVPNPVEINPSS